MADGFAELALGGDQPRGDPAFDVITGARQRASSRMYKQWRREVQAALDKLTQQATHNGRIFRRTFAQAQRGFASIAANTKGCDLLPVLERECRR